MTVRSISDIKDGMTTDFMRNEYVAKAYGFEVGDTFSSRFSKASVENLLFYVVACSTWLLEGIFAQFQSDVEARIDEIMPHRPKWYRDKALAFMKGKTLIADTDSYDTTGMTDDEIAAMCPVKYAAATENEDASILTIKVAGEDNGARTPLDSDTQGQLEAYIAEIKDAGVRIAVVNSEADVFNCEIDVYYDALILADDMKATCGEAVNTYIENLPFNGEYTNMSLVDQLQQIDGVRIVELKSAETEVEGESTPTAIDARYTPASGYFKAGNITLNMKFY